MPEGDVIVKDMDGNPVEYVVVDSETGEEKIHRVGWPTPISKDHTWVKVDYTCAHCGAVHSFHEQPQEWLDSPEGVKWECTVCNKINQLGGHSIEPATFVLECGECGATYQPDDPPAEIEYNKADGTFTCMLCGTPNRYVGHSDVSNAEQGQVKA